MLTRISKMTNTATHLMSPPLDDAASPGSKETFRAGMALLAANLNVIATNANGAPAGILATAVCSLSTEPPSLICCINKTASAHDAIVAEGRFSVNVMSEAQRDVASRFVSAKGAARFDPREWTLASGELPRLTHAAVVFDCDVYETHDGFSHTIIVGRVTRTTPGEAIAHTCLLWHRQDYARGARLGAA